MKRVTLLLVASIILASLLISSSALALGVAMGPQTIKISDALRGAVYESIVTVFNPSTDEETYTVTADGQAATWLSFYTGANQQAVQSLTVAGQGNISVLVKVQVPADTPNGTYTATIYAQSTPNDNKTGISVGVQASSQLTIGVTGTQILQGTVSDISTTDTEAGLPLHLEVIFKNTGNVAVQPKIDCQITKGDTKVATVSYAGTTVNAYSQGTVPVNWDTALDQAGDYVDHISVSIGDKIITTKDIPFKIVPPGTFTKLGELSSLTYDGKPVLGTMLKIQGAFKNTGQANIRANLMAEVYYGGNLVDTSKSEDTLVPTGQTGTLTSYYKLTKTGQYTIKAWVSYEGKQTGVKELTITSGKSTGTGSSSKLNSILIPVIVVVAILLIGFVYLTLRRKHKPA